MTIELDFGRAERERQEKARQAREENTRAVDQILAESRRKSQELIEKHPVIKDALSEYSEYLADRQQKKYSPENKHYGSSNTELGISDAGDLVRGRFKHGIGGPHTDPLVRVSESFSDDGLVVTFNRNDAIDPDMVEHVEQLANALRAETGVEVRVLDIKKLEEEAEQKRRAANKPATGKPYKPYFTGQIR